MTQIDRCSFLVAQVLDTRSTIQGKVLELIEFPKSRLLLSRTKWTVELIFRMRYRKQKLASHSQSVDVSHGNNLWLDHNYVNQLTKVGQIVM